ncbi:MAG: hypothetical protein IH840_05195 [Candidatus Heimdallarchaeota archaeon]|nr:hypothetical protein [Candidatus Heimdallarchaeota archaeon]
MSEITEVEYENLNVISTNDGFNVQIKVLIQYGGTNKSDVISLMSSVAKNYFKSISLMETLKLIQNAHSSDFKDLLQTEFSNHQLSLIDLHFSTIDAVEQSKVEIDVSADPSLEGRKEQKKKGLLGKLRKK